jgi:putative membrane protein
VTVEHGAHSGLQHGAMAPGFVAFGLVAVAVICTLALAYWWAAYRSRERGRPWSTARTLAFLSGCVLLALALSPWIMRAALGDFRIHMLQHLLIGMLAPLALVLGAPVSLLLRTLSRDHARRLLGLLHGAWLRTVSHPLSALLLNVGGMYLLYLSPLYDAMHRSLPLYAIVHVHFVLAGCLFSWSMLNGPDPVPRAHSPAFRLSVLFIGIAAHALLSKLMYAQGWPAGTAHSLEEIQAGAQWMYYGGDAAELLLLIALFARWRQARKGSLLFRDTRRGSLNATG